MPIYEYRCQDCGTKFEKLVRGTAEAPELACPSCGKTDLRQELSVFAAHSHESSKPSSRPPCAAGGCCDPGACGMNFN